MVVGYGPGDGLSLRLSRIERDAGTISAIVDRMEGDKMGQLFKYNIMLLKTIAVCTAAAMAVAGLVMIFIGTKGEGSIDLKAPFLEGKLQSGSVGILLIFFSIFIIVGCLFFRYKDKIEIKVGDVEMKVDGFLGEDRLKCLTEQIRELSKETHNESTREKERSPKGDRQ